VTSRRTATVGVGRSTSRWLTADVAGHVEQAEAMGGIERLFGEFLETFSSRG
jgi:hypothetical protein